MQDVKSGSDPLTSIVDSKILLLSKFDEFNDW